MPGVANSPSQVFNTDKIAAIAPAVITPSQTVLAEDGQDILAEDGQTVVTE